MSSTLAEAYQQVRKTNPFPGQMDRKLDKYSEIVSEVRGVAVPGSEILSIGAGVCEVEAILSVLGYHVTAVDDLSDIWHFLGRNRERIMSFAESHGVKLIIKPFEEAGLQQQFDVVILIDVLEHILFSPRELLNKVLECLKPGGALLVETPNAARLYYRLRQLLGKPNYIDLEGFYWSVGPYRYHLKEYTADELKTMMRLQGLKDVRVRSYNVATKLVDPEDGLHRVALKLYDLVSGACSGFRDTLMTSGVKPEGWKPVEADLEKIIRYRPELMSYNLDNQPLHELVEARGMG
ncbi:MAG: class I SAM-dependent methyltransferase [Candidatus Bathyarchaeota archaeon]